MRNKAIRISILATLAAILFVYPLTSSASEIQFSSSSIKPLAGWSGSSLFGESESIAVSVAESGPANQVWYPAKSFLPCPIMHIRVESRSSRDVILNSLTFQASGSGHDRRDISTVQLKLDSDHNGLPDPGEISWGWQPFSDDDGTCTINTWSTLLQPGEVADFVLTYVFSSTTPLGSTFNATLTSVDAVDPLTYDPVCVEGPPAFSSTTTFVENLPHIAVTRRHSLMARSGWWNGIDKPVCLADLSVTSQSDSDTSLTSIALKAYGDVSDTEFIEAVEVYSDDNNDGQISTGDTLLGSGTYPQGEAYLTVPLSSRSIPANETSRVLVGYRMEQGIDTSTHREFTFCITGMEAVITGSGAPIEVLVPETDSSRLILVDQQPTCSVQLAQQSPANSEWFANMFDRDVVVGVVDITAPALNSVDVFAVTLRASGTGNDQQDVNSISIRLDRNSNGIIDSQDYVVGSSRYPQDDGLVTIPLSMPGVNSGTTAKYLICYNLSSSAAVGNTYTSAVESVRATDAEYWIPADVSGLPVQCGKLRVVDNPASIFLAAKGANSPGDRIWQPSMGSAPFEVMQFSIRSDADSSITLDNAAFYLRYMPEAVGSLQLWSDSNSNGRIDTEDACLADNTFDASGRTNLPFNNSAGSAVLPPRGRMDFIVACKMQPSFNVTYPFEELFFLDAVNARWSSGPGGPVEVYGQIPLQSCLITVVPDAPTVKIGKAKAMPGGSNVRLADLVVTMVKMGFWLYAQEQDASAGILIRDARPGNSLKPGDIINVVGTTSAGSVSDLLDAWVIEHVGSAPGLPEPVYMANKAIGGGPIGNMLPMIDYYDQAAPRLASGLSNISLLVCTSGTVTYVDEPNYCFYIDDGSRLWDGTTDIQGNPVFGIRVRISYGDFYNEEGLIDWAYPKKGDVLLITGMPCMHWFTDSLSTRVLHPRSPEDVKTLRTAEAN